MEPWNLVKFSDKSEKFTALIFSRQSQQQECLLGLYFGPEDGGNTFLHTFNKLCHIQETEWADFKYNVIDLLLVSNLGRQSGYYD
jgi:hypothetical protein